MLMRIGILIGTAGLSLTTTCLHAAGVTVLFVPSDPSLGPYPSDALTVADKTQKTGRRVNVPAPDCSADRFGCIVQPALNRLDGFNPQPRNPGPLLVRREPSDAVRRYLLCGARQCDN